jgi:hypothetical protein
MKDNTMPSKLIKTRNRNSITFHPSNTPTLFTLNESLILMAEYNKKSFLNYKSKFHSTADNKELYIINVYFPNGEYIRTL